MGLHGCISQHVAGQQAVRGKGGRRTAITHCRTLTTTTAITIAGSDSLPILCSLVEVALECAVRSLGLGAERFHLPSQRIKLHLAWHRTTAITAAAATMVAGQRLA
jgi:hypothetical protein